MSIYRGNNQVTKLYVGRDEVQKVYVGTTQVWGSVVDSQPDLVQPINLPSDPRGFRGWDPNYDLGTSRDLLVDAAGGGDHTTISAAIAAASAGQTIKVRDGIYRERVEVTKSITIEGYGREKPVVTAADALTNWTQCDAADAGVIGVSLGTAGSPVYKKTGLSVAGLAHGEPLACNVFENNVRLNIATERADTSNLFTRRDPDTFHSPDNFILNGNSQITAIVHLSVMQSYTDAQLERAIVAVYTEPNVVKIVRPTGADAASGRVYVDGAASNLIPESVGDRYALINLAPALQRGTWAVVNHGTTFDLYVYPNDARNLDTIEYTTRQRVFNIANVNNVAIRGIHAQRASGTTSGDGINFYKGGLPKASNITIEHCASSGTDNVYTVPRSLRMVNVDNSVVRRSTFFDHLGGRGVFFSSASGLQGTGNLVERNYFERIGGAPFYSYDQNTHVEAHNYAKDCGLDAHSNKSNHYGPGAGFHQLLFWGNEFENCEGYVVWQSASAPAIAFNLLPLKSASAPWNRTLTDDNHSLASIPVKNSSGYVFNNTLPPRQGQPSSGFGIDLARNNSDITYHIANNVTHGINDRGDFVGNHTKPPALFASNIITYLGSGQSRSSFTAAEATIEETIAAVYEDYGDADYGPAANSPILTRLGHDMSATVTILAGVYTQFSRFDRDYKNQTIDWNDPFVGADAGLTWDHLAPDNSAPVLTNPRNTADGPGVSSGSVETNEAAGTLYWVVSTSATPPSAAQIKSGVDHTGATASDSGSMTVTAVGRQT